MKIHPTASESRTAQCSKIPKKVQFGEVTPLPNGLKINVIEFFLDRSGPKEAYGE